MVQSRVCCEGAGGLKARARRERSPGVFGLMGGLLAGFGLLVGVAGCTPRAMPTPLPFRDGGPVDAAWLFNGASGLSVEDASERASANGATVDVLFATNRVPIRNGDRVVNYGTGRNTLTNFGLATIRFGEEGSTADEVAALVSRNGRPMIEVVQLRELGAYWRTIPITDARYEQVLEDPGADHSIRDAERAFLEELRRRLPDSGRVLLYVPGFNTSFEAPLRFAGEFSFYLHGEATPVAFSWPARSVPFGYSKQLTNAELSVRSLRELIRLLGEQDEVKRIDVLAYSSGAPMTSDALLQLRLMHHELSGDELREHLKIGSVIYAGADEDIDRFRGMYLDGFGEIAERITIYSSRHDLGLLLSEFLVRGSKRLGRLAQNLEEHERKLLLDPASRTDVIDVTRAQSVAGGGGIYSHGYWFGNAWVSTDVLAQLRYGLEPEERGLVREASGSEDDPNPVWRFPKDYPEQAMRVYAERIRD